MNKTLPKNALLPSDSDRQKIFYWLKKTSSLTAWKRIFHYYQIWANAAEISIRMADDNGWGDKTAVPHTHYASILKGLDHCKEGVARLGKGDKRIFKFDAKGEFEMAARTLFHWKELINRIEEGENLIDREHTPLWQEFCDAAMDAYRAWEECSMSLLEPRYLEDSAPLVYNDWLIDELKSEVNAHVPEDLPSSSREIFISTDEYVPCSGIWEPITADVRKNLLASLLGRKEVPQAPFEIAGTMNYLHGGSKAPQILVETPLDYMEINTTWRLLWEDDRYIDGVIQTEESKYRFRQPQKVNVNERYTTPLEDIQWSETGAIVPVSGKWLLESEIRISSHFNAGDIFPQHQGRVVRWVLARN